MAQDINQRINITADDNASPAIRKIIASFKELQAQVNKQFNSFKPNVSIDTGALRRIGQSERSAAQALKSRFAFESRMAKQRQREANDATRTAARADAAALRSLKAKIAFRSRMSQQQAREEAARGRETARTERDHARAFGDRIRFGARMMRQRAAEERSTAREQAASQRETIRLGNYRFGLRERYLREQARAEARDRRDRTRSTREGFRAGRDVVEIGSRRVVAAGAIGAGAAGLSIKRAMGVERDVDDAEVNTRTYAGLSQDAARALRDQWAAPTAEALGTGPEKLLTAYTDAIKLGIPTSGAQAFAGLSTQTAAAWEVPFDTVTDVFGTLNTIMTSKGGPFDFGKLKSVANAIQHLAAKQSTTPERLLEFMRQGAGGGALLGMSLESTAAFGSASTSLGNRPGESGRMLDYIAGRTIELPRLTRKKGDEGKQARQLVASLGFRSAEAMDAQRRADPDAFLPDLMERFGRIRDPRKQDEAVRFFAGREWLGEFGRMVKGLDTYKEAANLAKESKGLDAIGSVWELHKTKLSFVMKQFSAGWRNILGEFGKELSPLARQAGDYFLQWTAQLRSGGLAARFKAAIHGLIEGLGFKDLPDMLRGVLGEPGQTDAGSIQAWGDAARGFGQGLREVGTVIKSLFGMFTGGDASAEATGRWTARILAFSAALVVASPAISIMGGIGSALMTLGFGAAAVLRVLRPGSMIAGGASGLLGRLGLAGIGGLLSRFFSLGLVAEIGARRGEISTWLLGAFKTIAAALRDAIAGAWDGIRAWVRKNVTRKSILGAIADEIVPAPMQRGHGDSIVGGGKPEGKIEPGDELPGVQKQSAATDWRNLIRPASFDGLTDAIDENTQILKQQINAEGSANSLIQRASLGSAERDGIAKSIREMGGRLQLASLGSPGLGASGGGGSFGGGGGGGSGTGSFGIGPGITTGRGALGSRGIIGGGAGNEGSPDQKSGGSRSWRNNNPGNIKAGEFANANGATGSDGVFAKFPTYEAGRKAQERLLFDSKNYRDLTLGQAIRRWAPASENNVPAYIAAMGADPSTKMRDFSPEQRGKLLDAMQQHEGWKVGTIKGGVQTAGLGNPGLGANGPGGNPVDKAREFLGMGERNGRSALESFMGGGSIVGRARAWCARFVNASLEAVGQKGSGSAVANSFLRWGTEISADMAAKGDVLVKHRGRGADQTGGHVGMATGRKQVDPRTGRLMLEMIQGNSNGDDVRTTWEDASKLSVRRSTQATIQEAARSAGEVAKAAVEGGYQDAFTDKPDEMWKPKTGWTKGWGGNLDPRKQTDDLVFRPSDKTGQDLAENMPYFVREGVKQAGTSLAQTLPYRSNDRKIEALLKGVPKMTGADLAATVPASARQPGGSGGGRGDTQNVHAPITIYGNGSDPESIAQRQQRHLRDTRNIRQHDLDYQSV